MADKTIIDIVDTAIKIGLGAFISGVSTYIFTKMNYNNENVKWKREAKLGLDHRFVHYPHHAATSHGCGAG